MSQQGEAAEQIVNMATNVTSKAWNVRPILQERALYPLPPSLSPS